MKSILGILLMSIGSLGAASFYVPIKRVKNWSWESYWIIQGIVSWLIAPWIFAYFTTPSGTLLDILSNSPSQAKWNAVIFGALWGVGGLTFGLSMRYLGVALGQSIALGFCAAFGTIIPPILNGENLFGSTAGILILIGVSICIAGIALIGYAGSLKDKGLTEEQKKAAIKDFALKKGLIIAVLAGIMSACFSLGLEKGDAIRQIGENSYHVNPLYSTNPVLIFILLGGFFTNLIYCGYLNIKNKTYTDYFSVSQGIFMNNILFCLLGGTLWFLQFFFLGMGKSMLPESMKIFSWTILMALNIAFSNIWGIILNEWKGTSNKTRLFLLLGIVVLILSTLVISLK
jgi:L-rhamnose-H+ transport protein